jgi:hypothetical protein
MWVMPVWQTTSSLASRMFAALSVQSAPIFSGPMYSNQLMILSAEHNLK